jgi:hypothetical protein
MRSSLFVVASAVLVLQPGFAGADKPNEEQLQAAFARELELVKADHVTGVAVVELEVTKVEQARYCPGRTARCGVNPTCGHPARKATIGSYSVTDTAISEGKVDVPETISNRLISASGDPPVKLKEGDTVWAAVIGYKGGLRNMTAPRKLDGEAAPRGAVEFDGKVVHNSLEGGFYGIVADDGTKYDPTNLPAQFKKAGMRVSVVGKKRPDVMSFHQWGTIIEIVEIKPAR